MYKAALICVLLIALTGCADQDNSLVAPSPTQVPLKDEVEDPTTSPDVLSPQNTPDSSPKPSIVENATFKDYDLPSWFRPLRELSHSDADATYILHEFELTRPLKEVDDWIRNESIRLGGEIVERYSYDITSSANLDLIVKLPYKTGTRIISTYTQKVMDKQHLVIEETVFRKPISIDQNYEDHALIIFSPLEDDSTKESFKGSYFHQHTDIYSIYFYSQAFFKELFEVNRYKLIDQSKLQYFVGYADKEGNEVFYDSVTDQNKDQFTFGIQLENDFLPKNELQRDRLLRHWAKTVLLGDKAYSRVIVGEEQINFVLKGKVLKSFTIRDLISDT
ncbi:hypothetical protein E5161_07335 [Cohnella pontilimi]|uniref:Uncharacterized protein n=1 Tax=Cohnella pontilimi TaxID=2564100 RepID=A0A4V6WEH6_9BACL|nr:hypothetical protein [Cohnella pontilimi]TJY42659.1 hypothetical protein E5161_07335 [Cohnella pontilimi]